MNVMKKLAYFYLNKDEPEDEVYYGEDYSFFKKTGFEQHR